MVHNTDYSLQIHDIQVYIPVPLYTVAGDNVQGSFTIHRLE